MITIHVANQITVDGLPENLAEKVQKSLTIENKEFFKMQRLGIRVPLEFKYWKTDKNSALIIPRGCLGRIKRFLGANNVAVEWTEELVKNKRARHPSIGLELRDYQKQIVDGIVDKRPTEGIINSSTGSGKTIMALEVINGLQLSATVVTPNTVMLEQFISECEKFYGFTPAVIDSKRKEVGPLTIATFQSLMSNEELLERVASQTSVLIIDEAQGIVSKERRRVLKAFRPAHLFGLSATPERGDGKTEAINFLLGQEIAKYEATMCTPTVEIVRTNEELPMFADYHRMVEAMVESKSRNKLIAGLVVGEVLAGRKVLVLTKRIKHYVNLAEILPPNPGYHFIDAADPFRNRLLHDLKEGLVPFSVIFGTISLLATGTDIPSLDTLIITCDIKSSVLTTQAAGRILRLFAGKPTPKIIDLYDNKHPIFSRQFYERKRLYETKKWEIKM